MDFTGLVGHTLNGMLAPFGVRVARQGRRPTIGGRPLSDAAVIEEAGRRGLTPGEYLEILFQKPGRAREIIDRMTRSGALSESVRAVCEIGPGSGLYVQHVLARAPVTRYEIYEIERNRSEYLAATFPVIVQPADGETLRSTASSAIHLIHAHGVFVTLDFLTACSYFREMVRVTAPGGCLVFDVVTEDCLDDGALRSWLDTPLRYIAMQSRDYVCGFFQRHGFTLLDEFVRPLLVHGSSRYLVFRRDEAAA